MGKYTKLVCRHLLSTCIASLPAAFIAHTASAQGATGELEQIVVTGKQETYFEDKNTTALKGDAADSETPFVVSSTNATFMEDIRAKNMEHVFDYTVGVNQASNGADGFVIRGFDIDLNNIKVNGMSGLTTRFGSPSVANIEKVEVLKGPASVLYGNMETGGMVNMVTKKPQETFSGRITTAFETFASDVSSFGEDNGLSTTVDLTGPVPGRDDLFYRLILTGNGTQSFRGDVVNEEYYLYGDLLWHINDMARLSLGVEVGKQVGDADAGLVALDNDINKIASLDTVYQDPGDFDNDKGLAVTASYQQDLENGQFNLNWRSVFHQDERKLFENNRVNDGPQTIRRRLRHQQNTRDWHGVDAYLNQNFATGTINHDVTLGVSGEYRLTDFDRVNWGGYASKDVSVYNPVLGGSAKAKSGNRRETEYYSLGFYAQDKLALSDALTVVASARHNQTWIDYTCLRGKCNADNSTHTSDTLGSLGAVYNFNDNWSVFGSIAQSFDPYTAERVGADGKPLDAEKSLQYEAGLRYQLGGDVNISASAYHITKDNVSESIGGGRYATIGEVESKGVELDVQWQPTENWQFKAGYAYNKSEATQGANKGLTPAHAPQNTAFLFTRYNIPQAVWGGELGFTMGVTYRDEVKTSISKSTNVTLPDHILTDVGVHYEKNNWNASLGVSNLFNEKHFFAGRRDTNIYAGDPRKISFSLSRDF
ncbi:MAG: TonB-dependent receptor [Cohaesibacter sp.]|nr:TonB-dependent receptor [Cohaesibacter sp.]